LDGGQALRLLATMWRIRLFEERGRGARACETQDVSREHLVARTQDADEERRRHDGGRRQAVGREVVARSEAERERDRCHEHHREHDLADTGAKLAASVEAAHPEHEHRDHREERKPVALRLPDDSPQRRPLAEIELPEDKCHPDAEDEACQVERHQGGNAGQAPGDGEKRGA